MCIDLPSSSERPLADAVVFDLLGELVQEIAPICRVGQLAATELDAL